MDSDAVKKKLAEAAQIIGRGPTEFELPPRSRTGKIQVFGVDLPATRVRHISVFRCPFCAADFDLAHGGFRMGVYVPLFDGAELVLEAATKAAGDATIVTLELKRLPSREVLVSEQHRCAGISR